jgi:hypothetical protein
LIESQRTTSFTQGASSAVGTNMFPEDEPGYHTTSPSDPLESAVAKFKKRLTQEELNSFEKTAFIDVLHELDRIQREQEQFKKMVNLARIDSFIKGMEQFGKIVEVFLNASKLVCFIWGPIKFILQVCYYIFHECKHLTF